MVGRCGQLLQRLYSEDQARSGYISARSHLHKPSFLFELACTNLRPGILVISSEVQRRSVRRPRTERSRIVRSQYPASHRVTVTG